MPDSSGDAPVNDGPHTSGQTVASSSSTTMGRERLRWIFLMTTNSEDQEATAPECVCGGWPGDIEGPRRECPIHGEEATAPVLCKACRVGDHSGHKIDWPDCDNDNQFNADCRCSASNSPARLTSAGEALVFIEQDQPGGPQFRCWRCYGMRPLHTPTCALAACITAVRAESEARIADLERRLGEYPHTEIDVQAARAERAEARERELLALLSEARSVCNLAAFAKSDVAWSTGEPLWRMAQRVRSEIDTAMRSTTGATTTTGRNEQA